MISIMIGYDKGNAKAKIQQHHILTVGVDRKTIKGNGYKMYENDWLICYDPLQSTRLYLHSREIRIGDDGIDIMTDTVTDNWDVANIFENIVKDVNCFNEKYCR